MHYRDGGSAGGAGGGCPTGGRCASTKASNSSASWRRCSAMARSWPERRWRCRSISPRSGALGIRLPAFQGAQAIEERLAEQRQAPGIAAHVAAPALPAHALVLHAAADGADARAHRSGRTRRLPGPALGRRGLGRHLSTPILAPDTRTPASARTSSCHRWPQVSCWAAGTGPPRAPASRARGRGGASAPMAVSWSWPLPCCLSFPPPELGCSHGGGLVPSPVPIVPYHTLIVYYIAKPSCIWYNKGEAGWSGRSSR